MSEEEIHLLFRTKEIYINRKQNKINLFIFYAEVQPILGKDSANEREIAGVRVVKVWQIPNLFVSASYFNPI